MQLAVLGGSSLLGGAGFFTKAALLGASVAGSMLLNGRKKPVGKLNDLRVSSASYGRGIPHVWGTMRVTGNMFWATEFREEKVYISSKGKPKSGGKGEKMEKKGKAQPVYKYYAFFAMGLCEGPVDEVLRIWADNNLIYNKYNPDDEDLVGPGFTTRDNDNTGKGSQRAVGGKKGSGGHSGRFVFRFHDGSEEQLPDPYMVKKEGEENVPAYRGLAYLMFEDFALEDFGNRIPTITAEIATKSQSKSLVLRMENDPTVPDGGWWNATGMNGPYVLDIQREMLYVGAMVKPPGEDVRTIIRVYDIVKRKEVKRIDFVELMPQTVEDSSNMFGYREWTKNAAKGFVVHGVTPQGDLVLYRMEGNYGTLLFFDPYADRIIKSWGINGNGPLTQPWNGILAQQGMLQVIAFRVATLEPPYPEALTAVYQRSGKVHLFDSSYVKIGSVGFPEWIDHYFIGTPATKQAMYGVSSNWGGTGQYRVYTADLTIPVGASMWSTGAKFLGKWPEVDGSRGNALTLRYASFIVGANCVGLIISAIDITGGGVYAIKMNPINGKILWEQRIDVDGGLAGMPTISNFAHPSPYNNTNYTTFYNSSQLVRIDWRQEKIEVEPATQGSSRPIFNEANYYWSERDASVTFVKEEGLPTYQPTIVYNDRKVQTNVSLAQICEDVAVAVGIPAASIVTTGLETQEPLNGYMYEQPTEARAILEELANCYQFDAVESDYQLIFKMRGGESILTIPSEHLGVVDADFGSDNERVVETIQQHAELPERVTVSYFNSKSDYENGTQYFKRPSLPIPVVHSHEHVEVTFNMALLNKYAKRMAKRILYAAWSERTTVEFKLPRDYMRLDPSDTVTIQLPDGRAIEVRITDITTGADMMLECAGVYNYPDSYKHMAETDNPEGLVKQEPSGVIDARPLIFNIPLMTDGDVGSTGSIGYYWAAGARKAGFNFGLLQSHGNGTWNVEGFTQLDAIWGTVDAVIPPPSVWNVEDNLTQIRLIPAFKFNEPDVVYSWESITDEEWPSERNTIIIGEEIILFKDVVENPDGTVTISRLIRGHRGSIDAAYRHLITDVWAVAHEGSVLSAEEDSGYLNLEQLYMVNTGVPFANLGMTRPATLVGSTEKPLPVGDVRRVNNENGSVTFSWSRATRYGGALKNGTGSVPLNEESEEYILFVTAAPYDAYTWDPEDPSKYIYKSAELVTPTVTLTSEELTGLGLSNTSDIHIVIHQMSTKVGYGYPHGLTKYYTRFS